MSYNLHYIPTRKDAYEILCKMKVNDLVDLARYHKIHIPRKNKKDIIERIINGTVGARLRSETIRNINVK